MLEDFETRILALIDGKVEGASDDELFAGGYLRGHLTLSVAELEEEGNACIESLSTRVEESVKKAIIAGELTPPDQVLVLNTWRSLLIQAKQQT